MSKCPCLGVLLVFLPFSGVVTARPKTDVVYFLNGDRLTCEIVSVDRGYLYVNLDYGDGTVSLNWLNVQRIESSQGFLVTDQAGSTITGAITTSPTSNPSSPTLVVSGAGGKREINRSQIVNLTQSERKFLSDLDGSVSGGLQFTQSNKTTQYNLAMETSYRRQNWGAAVTFTSSFSGSLSNASDLRNEIRLGWEHSLPKPNLYVTSFTYFLQSQPQQLNLRSVYGAGLARYFKHTNRSRIRGVAGLSWTREDYTDTTSVYNSAEGVIGASFEFFRFKTLSLTSTLVSYPSITDYGRIRLDTNTTFRWQLISNLYWNLNVYTNYDSRPPHSAVKTDSGVSSSVSWTY